MVSCKLGRGIFIFNLVLFAFFSSGFTTKNGEDFPTPTGIDNMLFYVQRSFNRNTIIYQLNTKENNEIDINEPIRMFWINYEGKGDREMLNTIQRKFAYGLDFSLTNKDTKTFCFNFVSYKSQKLYLIQSPNDKIYRTYSVFNHKLLCIKKIFIKIDGGSFWYPRVKYIEVSGRDMKTNTEVLERIVVEE